MSIVNEDEQRIYLPPEPDRARPVKSEAMRRRNVEWLETQRRLDLTVRELAAYLKVPTATVAQGLLWASEQEQRDEEAAVARERPPVLDPVSGLDADDVIYLLETYPPDTELGGHSMFWQIIGPLVEKILGPEPGELFAVQAA